MDMGLPWVTERREDIALVNSYPTSTRVETGLGVVPLRRGKK